MRPILLVLLVSYHAFAPFCGAWEIPSGVESNEFYKWLARLNYAFLLEGFIFLSGYVFVMQIVEKNKFNSINQIAVNKFHHLIIPCWIFGTAYYLIFTRPAEIQIGGIVSILYGIGHLWYLPCLFWCSCIVYFLIKKGYNEKLTLLVLAALMLGSIIYIPMQFNRAMYYMFFFYMGGMFWKYKDKLRTYANVKYITSLTILFAALLVTVNIYIEYTTKALVDADTLYKLMLMLSKVLAKAILATVGISTLYLAASLYMEDHTLNKTVMTIGTMGYGVYIFHQFVLKYLYYNIPFPEQLGTTMFPCVGLIIAIAVSLLLTWGFRNTKIGRKLI